MFRCFEYIEISKFLTLTSHPTAVHFDSQVVPSVAALPTIAKSHSCNSCPVRTAVVVFAAVAVAFSPLPLSDSLVHWQGHHGLDVAVLVLVVAVVAAVAAVAQAVVAAAVSARMARW